MNRRFENAALDIPGVGRLALLSEAEGAVRTEAQDLMLSVVEVRARALLVRAATLDFAGMAKRANFPQTVTIYDGDRAVATLKPGRDADGNSCPEYTAVQ